MARGFASSRAALAALSVAVVLVTGCSGQGSAEHASADGPLVIETSPGFVTFQNRAGLPLTAVSITIRPYGPGEFTRQLSRVENTMKRQLALAEFRSRDGAALNVRVTRPKSVRVRAEDAAGKTYELEVPWK
jgi:hypothetical protein